MKKYHVVLLFFVIAGLSSCLKESPALDPKESNNVVEIYNLIPTPTASPADAIHPAYTKAFDIVPTGEYSIFVSYSGADVAPEDITVNIGLDDGARLDYNSEQTTSYEKMPLNLYNFATLSPVIKKGERVAEIKVSFKPDQFNPALTYALPVKILSTSFGKISGNFGTVLFLISAKNKYDGIYKVTGSMVHSANTYVGDYPKEIWLTTVNGNTVDYFDKDWEAVYYIIVGTGNNGSTAGGYYLLHRPRFVFDLATDKLTQIRNAQTGALTAATISPTNNQFTFNPKHFTLNYTLSGGAFNITEDYEYVGPRP